MDIQSARRNIMSAKKKPVTTPLHLLQQLTASLLEHFEDACTQALTDAEKILAKLEKQRAKVQQKLHKQRSRVEDAAAAGKAKAQAKARANVEALEGSLSDVQRLQGETRQYIGELKNDIQSGLALVQGVGKVREAVAQALDRRATTGKGTAVPASGKPARKPPTRPAVPRSGAGKPATPATDSAADSATTKPAGRRPSARKTALAAAVHPGDDSPAVPAAAPLTRRAPRKPRAAAEASTLAMAEAPRHGPDGPANG
jgi:hypothetical protein